MGTQVTVRCPECGETLKLKSRASLGKKRPCPKCEVPFVLDEESNQSSYDLDLNARGVSHRRETDKPVLKRGVSRNPKAPTRKTSGPRLDIQNQPVLLGLGAGGLIGAGMLLAWLIIPRGNATPPAEQPAGQEQVSRSETTQSSAAHSSQAMSSPVPRPTAGSSDTPGSVRSINRSQSPQDVDWATMQRQGFDLLAAVNPADAQRGKWSRDGAAIVSRGNGILPLGMAPVGDYRVSMRFTREEGNEQINLILPLPGNPPRQFLVVIDWRGGGDHGIETLRGATPGGGNPTNSRSISIENGQEYRVNVNVDVAGAVARVSATMNSTKLFAWEGPRDDLNNPYWPTDDLRMIGIGSGSGGGTGLVVRYNQFVVNPLSNWHWDSLPRGVVLAGTDSHGPASSATSVPVKNTPPTTEPSRNTSSSPPRTAPSEPPPRTAPPSRTVVASGRSDERWWQFRGSDFNRTKQTGLPTRWSESENVVWKVDLPERGGSSPIVEGDRVFVTSYSGYGLDKETPGNPRALVRHLWVIDRNTGSVIRDHKFTARRQASTYEGYLHVHGYASHSPCSDGQRVFVHFGNSGVYAFDLDGNKLWDKDVGEATGGFGSAGSPVIVNGMLIINASIESERLIALNPENGDEIWSTRLGQSYTTPVLVRAGDRDEIVVPSGRDGRGVVGFSAATGEPLWEWKGYKSNRYICASPIVHNGVIYATGSVDGPLGAIRPGGNGDVTGTQQVWRGAPFDSDVTSPVFHNGQIFWLGGRSMVFDARSGDRVGQARIGGGCWATPLLAENRLYVVTQVEGVRILEANSDLTEIAQNVIREPGPQDNWNASPVPDRGQLLLRSPKALYCIGN